MDDKMMKWRRSPLHRKCIFCKYLKLIVAPVDVSCDYYKCIAKDKHIDYNWPDMTRIPRPFCKLFQLDME